METQENNSWSLFQNGNGEWISETKMIILFDSFATKLKALADEQGRKLNIHRVCDGDPWCYRPELESLNLRGFKMTVKEYKTLVCQCVKI